IGDVVGLREILVEVVQLALVVIGVPLAGCEAAECFGIDFPWDSIESPAGEPAVLIHRAVSQNLEILLRMSRWRFGVIEREKKTHAVHRHLWHAIDLLWFGQAGRFKNSRCDICTMSELTAHTAFVSNAFWPRDHHRVTDAAESRRHLLSPLEGCVA